MYVRFVVHELDEDSGRKKGVIQALVELADNKTLDMHENAAFEDTYGWLVENLKEPYQFSRSKKYHAKNVALSWFKDSAVEHIAKMRSLIAILDTHGLQVEMLRTSRPGYIIYEDEFQVVAEPFAETGA